MKIFSTKMFAIYYFKLKMSADSNLKFFFTSDNLNFRGQAKD